MDLGIDFEKQYQLDIYLKMIKWNTTFSEKKKLLVLVLQPGCLEDKAINLPSPPPQSRRQDG